MSPMFSNYSLCLSGLLFVPIQTWKVREISFRRKLKVGTFEAGSKESERNSEVEVEDL